MSPQVGRYRVLMFLTGLVACIGFALGIIPGFLAHSILRRKVAGAAASHGVKSRRIMSYYWIGLLIVPICLIAGFVLIHR